jgi:hypothetical protein
VSDDPWSVLETTAIGGGGGGGPKGDGITWGRNQYCGL